MAIGGHSGTTVHRWALDASKYRDELRQVAGELRKQERANRDLVKVQQALGEQMTRTEQAMSRFGGVAKIALGGIVAQAAGAAASKLKEAATEAREFIDVSRAFGGDITTLRKASRGLISDLDLMRQQLRLNTLGVQVNSEKTGELIAASQRLAPIMGTTTKNALESLAAGLGRGSKMMLDNLGVVFDTRKAYEKYAKTLGKTSAELTDAEKKLAFQTEAIEQLKQKAAELPAPVDTASDKLRRLTTQLENLTHRALAFMDTNIGEYLGALVDPHTAAANEAIRKMHKIRKDLGPVREFGASGTVRGGGFAPTFMGGASTDLSLLGKGGKQTRAFGKLAGGRRAGGGGMPAWMRRQNEAGAAADARSQAGVESELAGMSAGAAERKLAEAAAEEKRRDAIEDANRAEENRLRFMQQHFDLGEKLKAQRAVEIGELQGLYIPTIKQAGAAVVQSAMAAIQAEENVGAAILGALSKIAAGKMAFHAAEGIGKIAMSIWPPNPAAAVSGAKHLAAAAAFGILAGGFGAASSAASGGGGGGGAGAGTGADAARFNTRDRSGRRTQEQSDREVVVNLQIDRGRMGLTGELVARKLMAMEMRA